MTKSMTGFGKAETETTAKRISVEIRALNSKQLDLSLKIPVAMRPIEYKLRQLLAAKIFRGKAEATISMEDLSHVGEQQIDLSMAAQYLDQLKTLSESLKLPLPDDVISIIMRMPEVTKSTENKLDEEMNQLIFETLNKAITAFDEYRKVEGEALQQDIKQRITLILSLIKDVELHEHDRLQKVKERMRKGLEDLDQNGRLDANRYEQELIYYIERLDITEEKVRLAQHCTFFNETLSDLHNGRKLSFISQEIGREINTIGAKANDAHIQRIVVRMKDELEKVKEQLYNVL